MRTLATFLCAAALIAFAPRADAISLSPNGLGQLLIYPYYTVNKDQDTLISVANTTDIGKYVSVYVMEGYNGRTVLMFDLLLSPHDVWTAAITQDSADGGAVLRTSDTSCTSPVIPAGGVAFRSGDYDGSGGVPADAGPQGITRTREGFIALLARGDILPGSDLAEAITHVQNGTPGGGAPPDCDVVRSLGAAGIIAPTNGIYGSGSIVDVGVGTFFTYNADALADYTAIPLVSGNGQLITQPFEDANSTEATTGVARSYSWDANGAPVVADWAFGVDAVSAVLMADSIQNEYLVSPTLGANTDWVVTLPTKALYVDDIYGAVPFPLFVESFHAPGVSNVATTANHYDREEGASTQPPICETGGCMATSPISLAFEVNVLSYVRGSGSPATPFASGTPSRVLGSTLTPSALDPNGSSGFSQLDLFSGDGGHQLAGGVAPDGADLVMNGLPAVGFMVYNIINTDAQPGLLANYGGTFAHKATTSCVGNAAACAVLPAGGGE